MTRRGAGPLLARFLRARMSRSVSGVLLASLLAACSGAETPIATAAPASPAVVQPLPTPTADPEIAAAQALLAHRDAAWRAKDVEGAIALTATDAPAAFRLRERALAEIAAAGVLLAPERRTFVSFDQAGGLRVVNVVERDSQGRSRRLRYFMTPPGPNGDAARLTEPALASLGEEIVVPGARFVTRARPIDAEQVATALGYAEEAVPALVSVLGEVYRPTVAVTLAFAPTTVPDLPPLASAYTNGTVITFLSSQSSIVGGDESGPWSKTVVAHELAHVMLFARGTGPFVLSEGLPLWLTDDRRQPELDRIVAANAFWTLDHLIAGPKDATEFFAGYAQASSFVRYLAATHGVAKVLAAWEAGRTAPFPEAFSTAFGMTAEAAYGAWRDTLRRR